MPLAVALVLLGQSSSSSTPADVIGPVLNTVLGFGVLGAAVIMATLGRIDLHPSAGIEREAELKAINRELLTAINGQNLISEGAVKAIGAMTTELAALRAETTELRLEVARGRPEK